MNRRYRSDANNYLIMTQMIEGKRSLVDLVCFNDNAPLAGVVEKLDRMRKERDAMHKDFKVNISLWRAIGTSREEWLAFQGLGLVGVPRPEFRMAAA